MLSLLLSVDPEHPRFGEGFALAAYIVIFAALFGYIGAVHLQARKVERRLRHLEEFAASGRREES